MSRRPKVVREYYGYARPRWTGARRRRSWRRPAHEIVLAALCLILVLYVIFEHPDVRAMFWIQP